MFSKRKNQSQSPFQTPFPFSSQSLLYFQLLCLILLLQHGLQRAAAAHTQFKPQQGLQQQKLPQGQAEQQQLQPQDHVQNSLLQQKEMLQDAIKSNNAETEFNDPYSILNELKQDAHLSPPPPSPPFPFALPWNPNPNPYMNQPYPPPISPIPQPYPPFSPTPFSSLPFPGLPLWETPKFLPYIGYPQPMFIPYPFFMPPEIFYPAFPSSINEYEDTMSRAPNGRRPLSQHARNSPIYYMRLPPTPYMFLPTFGYPPTTGTSSSNFGNNFPPISSFQAFPTFPNLGSTFNVPVNFLANGKPSGIYQMNSLPNNFAALNNFNIRPPMQPNFNGNYFPNPFGIPTPNPPPPNQDSKLTSIKEPFIFNGRPENMYILQNGFNPLYSGI